MLTIEGLDIGHGLCVVLQGPKSTMVFDCGSHGIPGRTPWPVAHRRLVEHAVDGPPIGTIALSHLHWDHYCGLLQRIPNLAHDLQIVVPRFPEIEPDPKIADEFAARLMAFSPLDTGLGPIEIDLMRRIRQYAPQASPRPISAGQSFVGADHCWDVLWPPRRIRLGQTGMRTIEQAIEAYDEAAEGAPWLSERLDAIRDSELYNRMLHEIDDDNQRQQDPVELEVEDDSDTEDERDLNGYIGDHDDRLARAAKALSAAANLMSLIVVNGDTALLTGDARPTATNAALSTRALDRVEWLQTPHHGSRSYASARIRDLASTVRFSSAGPPHAHTVDDRYGEAPGIHHRTDENGTLLTQFHAGRVRALVWKPW